MKAKVLILASVSLLIGCIFTIIPRGYEERYIYSECSEEICAISLGQGSGEWYRVYGLPYPVNFDNIELRKKDDVLYDKIILTKDIDSSLTHTQKIAVNFLSGAIAGVILGMVVVYIVSAVKRKK